VADPLDDANEILEELRAASMRTSQGDYVRLEHVEKLIKKRVEAKEEALKQRVEEPPPKTLLEARRRAARDLKEAFPPSGPREPGKAYQGAGT